MSVYSNEEATRLTTKVYVTNKINVPYESATEFGTLRFMTVGSIGGLTHEQMETLAAEALHDAGPEDYILTSGSMAFSIIAVALMLIEHGKVNLLFWDTVLKDYTTHTLYADR